MPDLSPTQALARNMTEAQLLAHVKHAAKVFGWRLSILGIIEHGEKAYGRAENPRLFTRQSYRESPSSCRKDAVRMLALQGLSYVWRICSHEDRTGTLQACSCRTLRAFSFSCAKWLRIGSSLPES